MRLMQTQEENDKLNEEINNLKFYHNNNNINNQRINRSNNNSVIGHSINQRNHQLLGLTELIKNPPKPQVIIEISPGDEDWYNKKLELFKQTGKLDHEHNRANPSGETQYQTHRNFS